jgi:hypothetical protein
MEPDQFESILKVGIPFLRYIKESQRSIRADFQPERLREVDYGFFRVGSHMNPRCCSRRHLNTIYEKLY